MIAPGFQTIKWNKQDLDPDLVKKKNGVEVCKADLCINNYPQCIRQPIIMKLPNKKAFFFLNCFFKKCKLIKPETETEREREREREGGDARNLFNI